MADETRADTEALLRMWNEAMGTAGIERAGNALAAALRERDAQLEQAAKRIEFYEPHLDRCAANVLRLERQLAPFLALAREARDEVRGWERRTVPLGRDPDSGPDRYCTKLAALAPTEGQADG